MREPDKSFLLRREAQAEVRNGIRLFPSREDGAAVTPDLVKALLEETD